MSSSDLVSNAELCASMDWPASVQTLALEDTDAVAPLSGPVSVPGEAVAYVIFRSGEQRRTMRLHGLAGVGADPGPGGHRRGGAAVGAGVGAGGVGGLCHLPIW